MPQNNQILTDAMRESEELLFYGEQGGCTGYTTGTVSLALESREGQLPFASFLCCVVFREGGMAQRVLCSVLCSFWRLRVELWYRRVDYWMDIYASRDARVSRVSAGMNLGYAHHPAARRATRKKA